MQSWSISRVSQCKEYIHVPLLQKCDSSQHCSLIFVMESMEQTMQQMYYLCKICVMSSMKDEVVHEANMFAPRVH